MGFIVGILHIPFSEFWKLSLREVHMLTTLLISDDVFSRDDLNALMQLYPDKISTPQE